ncbi:unnamed protein product [Rotaria sordida]|uniref:G-protein coupled receptors family 1 profile domain-containing protein n=1 Tax=Rotaria sordida TaxID=392033 RepID=A0A819A209_9BILA|nr:unnamed protein product [Rotaria sordida]CAF3777836.1 unnamed protein product [Rotaria sordida]
MNLSNSSQCLNGGQYFRYNNETSKWWSCKCLPCFKGSLCEIQYNYIQFSWTSLISVDIQYSKTNNEKIILKSIYFIITTLIFLISIIQNVFCLITYFRKQIRITTCGIYLINYSLYSLLSITLREITIINTIIIDKYNFFICPILPALSSIIISLSLWTSSFIAAERMLIECFGYSLYRTRKYSFIFSIILLNLIFLTHITEFKRRKLKPDPILPNIYRCTSDDFEWSEKPWKIIDRILTREYLHIGVPCLLHLISTIFILPHIVKHKIYINETENQFWQILLIQLKRHKDFLIPPILVMLCTLPRLLVELITSQYCLDFNMKFILRIYILFRYIYYLPQTIPFFIYVYPSSVYTNQFRQTKIALYLFKKNKTFLSQTDVMRKEKRIVDLKLLDSPQISYEQPVCTAKSTDPTWV